MSSPASSSSTETIINVVFGLTATAISIVTVWQGRKAWKIWRQYARDQGNIAADVELDLRSLPSTPTSPEAPEREEIVAASAPSSDHVEDVTGPEHTLVPTPGPQLQSTLPTSIDEGTSFSQALAQGAQTADNGYPEVHTENAQPVMTNSERLELRPAGNDDI